MKKSPKNLRKLNVAIVSHIFATGPALDLEEYLRDKVNSLLFVGHPFSFRKEVNSFYRYHENGELKREHKAFPWRLPDVLLYLKDAFYTLWWVLRSKQKIDLYVGSDNFDAFMGLFLKKLGKVDGVVLYTIDYIPERFKNPVLNYLYHFFDKQCLRYCKVVWNVSPVMASAREKYKGLKEENCAPQIVVPLGMWYKRIPQLSFTKREKYQLVFMGHILEKQGLAVVIQAMPKILEKLPKVKLVIMGTGEDENFLKDLSKRVKVDKNIIFTGYVVRHEDIEKELARSTVAVAMYKPDPRSFTHWADPGKLKNYLAAGLPIVLTSVPPIAKEIEKKRCGIIAEYKKKDFASKTINLLCNRKMLMEYSKNARRYSAQFDWDKVFSMALNETLS